MAKESKEQLFEASSGLGGGSHNVLILAQTLSLQKAQSRRNRQKHSKGQQGKMKPSMAKESFRPYKFSLSSVGGLNEFAGDQERERRKARRSKDQK